MSDSRRKFEEHFGRAISDSLGGVTASHEIRARLLRRLSDEASVTPPPGLSEESATAFDRALADAVEKSVLAVTAPESVRRRVLEALQREKVTPLLPKRSHWRGRFTALTSLAAGFAIVFLSFFSSTETALASSVSADHRTCCQRAQASEAPTPESYRRMLEARFGKIPVPQVSSEWELKLSQICPGVEGQLMVHFLYTREREQGEFDTMSLHFIPKADLNESFRIEKETVHEVAGAELPVIAWGEDEWICTACSSELSTEELRRAVGKAAG